MNSRPNQQEHLMDTIRENWMTPNTMDVLDPKSQEALDHEHTHRQGRSNPNNLRDQVSVQQGQTNWPTPMASDMNWRRPTETWQGESDLPSVTYTWATQEASHPGPQDQANQTSGEESLQSDQTLPQHLQRRLNPSFVEWLMGVPIGWTSLKPLETESYLRWWHCFSGDY